MKLCSSNTTVNLPSESRNVVTHSGKTINCANNLEKHLRSCEKSPTHPVKQQLRLDGPTSSENERSTPKKFMVEKVQVDGTPTEHAEHQKTPEIGEFAFRYTAFFFNKTFNIKNKRDVLQQLKEVIHSTRLIIEGQTRANADAVK